MSSWTKTRFGFKSRLRVVVQFLFRSRENKAKRCRELKEKLDDAKRELAKQATELRRRDEEIDKLTQQLRRAETERKLLAQEPITLPDDPPVNGHGYGARTVSLSVELAKTVGLRAAEQTMKIMFGWLGVEQKVPDYTTIRTWMQRLGLAALQEPAEKADDWVWLVDHSNQVGPEKLLMVQAVRASQLPPPGTPLKHENVRVLVQQPGTEWKREDMAKIYTDLADKYGAPRAVLCDGASELREGAECLKTQRPDTLVLGDFKHKAANFLKALLGKQERFNQFNAQVGRTRSAIQQTELAHLTPPSQKHKARFMNLSATLEWSAMALWALDHPEVHADQWGVTVERLEEKLGWLREYADDLDAWRECQQVINKGLTFINEQGIFDGAARQLHALITPEPTHAASRRLAKQLVHFVGMSECHLHEGERLPLSTEILESSFGLYKQLERQHSKGGFTSLLASFPALLKKTSPQMIKQAFSSVSVKDVKQWIDANLGATLMSKRRTLYAAFKNATTRATDLPAAA